MRKAATELGTKVDGICYAGTTLSSSKPLEQSCVTIERLFLGESRLISRVERPAVPERLCHW